MNKIIDNKEISVAPMLDWTDRHCRYFYRLISPSVTLYSEMVSTGAIIHGDKERFLRFNKEEKPLVLQLGGSDADDMAECARIGQDYGYDEININCGCPSDRVQKGSFGACLMASPELVAKAITEMNKKVSIPVTVKCRIAIDEYEEYPFLKKFIDIVGNAGCKKFIIHARKAWLKGLSPKENRDIPPLNYDLVKKIKKEYQNLEIILNGGIKNIEQIKTEIDWADGVMIGRGIYQNPWFLKEIEKEIYGRDNGKTKKDIALAMADYIEKQMIDDNVPIKSITRHMINLFHNQKGARIWRRTLSEKAHISENPNKLINEALEQIE